MITIVSMLYEFQVLKDAAEGTGRLIGDAARGIRDYGVKAVGGSTPDEMAAKQQALSQSQLVAAKAANKLREANQENAAMHQAHDSVDHPQQSANHLASFTSDVGGGVGKAIGKVGQIVADNPGLAAGATLAGLAATKLFKRKQNSF